MDSNNYPIYKVEEAARVVLYNISPEIKSKFTIEQIIDVLDEEFEFLKQLGLVSDERPPKDSGNYFLDTNELVNFLVKTCPKKGISISYEEVSDILDAEIIYMKQIGIIEENDDKK